MPKSLKTKLRANKYIIPTTLTYDDGYIYCQFPFSRQLMAEIKAMEGAHWCGYDDPPKKIWRINDTPHNAFQLSYLKGENPYAWYDSEIIKHEYTRPVYQHQAYGADFLLSKRQAILAAEMGCVKGSTYVTIRKGRNKAGKRVSIKDFYNQFHNDNKDLHFSKIYRPLGFEIKTIIGSRAAYVKVENVLYQGIKPVLYMALDNGKHIEVTEDHKLSCGPNRWKEAKDFKIDDIVCCISDTGMLEFARVIRIIPQESTEVYDISCRTPHHHFLANGIHVHNCGKSLVGIEVMERSGVDEYWYVGPKSAIKAVERELKVWDCKVNPQMLTYHGLVKIVKNWEDGQPAPQFLWLDESARCKSPNTQRSQAALFVANNMRSEYYKDAFIILTSGAPAPKSPLDWFHQCRIACPGFLKEGTYSKFRDRLAIITKKDNAYGQAYPEITAWLDDERKCASCGKLELEHHLEEHPWTPSINEVEKLGKRMSGLVVVQFKKDCLDLPDKIYRKINLEPTAQIKDIAKALVAGSSTVAKSIILLRELSDGFQYIQKKTGTEVCPVCNGDGKIKNMMLGADLPEDSLPDKLEYEEYVICDGCGGSGNRPTYSRDTVQIPCPKQDTLIELLDEFSDVGRLVIYGGFTGSIDRIIDICKSQKWNYIKADGRGWTSDLDDEIRGTKTTHLDIFQDKLVKYPRVAFIGQPDAAGEGLTLTASPAIVYYSNSFNGNSRIQSEDRCHRPGMDVNRGCTIIDICHLPTDELILENLKKKRDLQAVSLEELKRCLG